MKTHDYSERYWGHDYTVTEIVDQGNRIHALGWGHGLRKGDFVILQNKGFQENENPTTRYKIESIEYYPDPKDMWRGWFSFSPRPNK